MNHHTDPINEKAPGAINTEGLATDATNDLNFATGTRHSKAIATQVAQLEMIKQLFFCKFPESGFGLL